MTYSDFRVQVAVMIMSLGFIAFVTLLHIVGKVSTANNVITLIVESVWHVSHLGLLTALTADMLWSCVLQLRGN